MESDLKRAAVHRTWCRAQLALQVKELLLTLTLFALRHLIFIPLRRQRNRKRRSGTLLNPSPFFFSFFNSQLYFLFGRVWFREMESTLEEDEGGKTWRKKCIGGGNERTKLLQQRKKNTRRREDASVSWPRLTHRDANRDAKRVGKGFTLTQWMRLGSPHLLALYPFAECAMLEKSCCC